VEEVLVDDVVWRTSLMVALDRPMSPLVIAEVLPMVASACAGVLIGSAGDGRPYMYGIYVPDGERRPRSWWEAFVDVPNVVGGRWELAPAVQGVAELSIDFSQLDPRDDLSARPFYVEIHVGWVAEPPWDRFADVVAAVDAIVDVGYAEMGPGGGASANSNLSQVLPWQTRPRWDTGRQVLRGYNWLTVCPAELVDRLGGVATLSASGAFYRVVALDHGGACLQATPTLQGYDLPAARRVFQAVRPVLPAGVPDLRRAWGAILVDEDAAAEGR
jgi:hypothetical protein